jgi:transposase
MKKIDFETRQFFRQMYMKGKHSLKEIAEILGISHGSACNMKDEYFPDVFSTNQKIDKKLIKRFKTLYLSKIYSIEEITKHLCISRTTAYRLKDEFFPMENSNQWRRKMFAKLYEAGTFSIEEMTGLLGTSRTSVLRFKREFEKFKGLKT